MGGAFFFQTGVPGAFGACLWEPCQVAVPASQSQVCCGANFTLSIDASGVVRQWGVDCEEVVRLPTVVQGFRVGSRVVQVACGRKHSLALTDGHDVYSWGLGSSGQLGHGEATTHCARKPQQINCLRDRHRDPPRTVHAGGNTSGIVTVHHAVLLWGNNQFGQVRACVGVCVRGWCECVCACVLVRSGVRGLPSPQRHVPCPSVPPFSLLLVLLPLLLVTVVLPTLLYAYHHHHHHHHHHHPVRVRHAPASAQAAAGDVTCFGRREGGECVFEQAARRSGVDGGRRVHVGRHQLRAAGRRGVGAVAELAPRAHPHAHRGAARGATGGGRLPHGGIDHGG